MNGLENNLDGFAAKLLLVVAGAACLVILVGIVAVVVQDRRRARERAARASAARERAARAAQRRRESGACDVPRCEYGGLVPVYRRDTRELVKVCHGHLDEGLARGWWLA